MFAGERAYGRDNQRPGKPARSAQPHPQRGLIFPLHQPRRGHYSKHLWPRAIHPAEAPTKPSGPTHRAPLPIPAYTPRSAGQKPESGKRQPHIFRRRCRPPGTHAAWETKNQSATRQTSPQHEDKRTREQFLLHPSLLTAAGNATRLAKRGLKTKDFQKRPSLKRCCKAITIAEPSLTTPSTRIPR